MPAPVDLLIDERRCRSCGICIDFCPPKVLVAEKPLLKARIASLERCTACRLCEILCPDWAITVIQHGRPAASAKRDVT